MVYLLSLSDALLGALMGALISSAVVLYVDWRARRRSAIAALIMLREEIELNIDEVSTLKEEIADITSFLENEEEKASPLKVAEALLSSPAFPVGWRDMYSAFITEVPNACKNDVEKIRGIQRHYESLADVNAALDKLSRLRQRDRKDFRTSDSEGRTRVLSIGNAFACEAPDHVNKIEDATENIFAAGNPLDDVQKRRT